MFRDKHSLHAAIICGAIALAATAGVASAQTVAVPQVTNVGPNDLIQVIPNGAPVVGNVYAKPAQINAVQGYKNLGTVSTDPAYVNTNGVFNIFAHASGTITAVTITMEPAPADGKRVCYWADQITTTLTWTANTGQSIDSNKHAAGAQYISNCMVYQASNATWYSSN